MRKANCCGVYQHRKGLKRFQAVLRINGWRCSLGYYDTEENAGLVVDHVKWFVQDFLPKGPAHLNFPDTFRKHSASPMVKRLRRRLLELGFPNHYDHGTGFDRTAFQAPSI